MRKHFFGFLLVSTLATVAAVGPGCVSQRPSRNGVFNENQYLRKDFLVRAGDGSTEDSGWFMRATVLNTSQPNPIDALIIPGTTSEGWMGMFNLGAKFVRFKVTQDKLQMISMRELSPTQKGLQRTEEVINSWPVTNVDLKYRVNLDGEKTNFYEENQELDWQVRQWVKVNLNKYDFSDMAVFGPMYSAWYSMCLDEGHASVTLVPESMKVDEDDDYMEWTLNVTIPVNYAADPACMGLYDSGTDEAISYAALDRSTFSYNMKLSFQRARPLPKTAGEGYQPLVLDEKDPIQHKYYPFMVLGMSRDQDSGLLAARQMVNRWDPNKDIVWYFAPNTPDFIKETATGPNGLQEQTNKLFEDAGVKARVVFKEWNADGIEREYGDIRYSFIRWMPGYDNTQAYAGLTSVLADPRTGEMLSCNIDLNDVPFQDYYIHRIDAYLKMLGASNDFDSPEEWPNEPAGCKDGDLQPIVPEIAAKNHNGSSSLYTKMQGYLLKPVDMYGPLGPKDFVAKQDEDFHKAYHAVLPYQIFADPDQNPFVVREGGAGVYGPDGIEAMKELFRKEHEFHVEAGKIDRGEWPVPDMMGEDGPRQSLEFVNKFRSLMQSHQKATLLKENLYGKNRDPYDVISFEGLMAANARRCVDGAWETKAQWADRLYKTYWRDVFWHEFGHSMGLHHNFMGSIDRPNFPRDEKGEIKYYSSSVMEYSSAPVRLQDMPGWLPYDEGAISFMYSNNGQTDQSKAGTSISGQSKTDDPAFVPPWKDPKGFDASGKEKEYLFCSHQHLQYTPLCRMSDAGTTPSEIMANDIDRYEWQYQWRNFRKYRKVWNNAWYAGSPANQIIEMRRFLSLWAFDWNGGELYDMFRRIGLPIPDGVNSNVQYYSALTDKFNREASTANQLAAALHKAVIQQSAGERPYRTIYDKYYGDVTQQGIILDKLYSMIGWVGLWPTENYDVNQAGGYISSYSSLGDASYAFVSEDTIASMIGGQYDAYPYFVPFAVGLFAQDTHDPAFNGRLEVRDWIGGHVFDRLQDFLDFWRDMAIEYKAEGCASVSLDECKYDPRPLSDKHNEFIGPDKRTWMWAYVHDRNQWVVVRKDRHIASYMMVRTYNDYVVYQLDDGHYPGGAYYAQLPVKYFLDYFRYFN